MFFSCWYVFPKFYVFFVLLNFFSIIYFILRIWSFFEIFGFFFKISRSWYLYFQSFVMFLSSLVKYCYHLIFYSFLPQLTMYEEKSKWNWFFDLKSLVNKIFWNPMKFWNSFLSNCKIFLLENSSKQNFLKSKYPNFYNLAFQISSLFFIFSFNF